MLILIIRPKYIYGIYSLVCMLFLQYSIRATSKNLIHWSFVKLIYPIHTIHRKLQKRISIFLKFIVTANELWKWKPFADAAVVFPWVSQTTFLILVFAKLDPGNFFKTWRGSTEKSYDVSNECFHGPVKRIAIVFQSSLKRTQMDNIR